MTTDAASKVCAIWLTGLPASGKSTIARELTTQLETLGLFPRGPGIGCGTTSPNSSSDLFPKLKGISSTRAPGIHRGQVGLAWYHRHLRCDSQPASLS
ncbi:MAG: adenylyl-sulfate kinase [Nitrospira sp.]|nr:adenylyl-sulfate kinase [Nitrospira sp.]